MEYVRLLWVELERQFPFVSNWCACYLFSVHPLCWWPLDCSRALTVVNTAAVSTGVKIALSYPVFISFVNKPNLLGHLRQCSVAPPCLTLCPMDCSPPDSSVHGISQARILQWVGISFSRRPSRLGDRTCISCVSGVGRQILYRCARLGSPICDSSYVPNHAQPSLALGLLDAESLIRQVSSHCSRSVALTPVFLEFRHTAYLTFWVT